MANYKNYISEAIAELGHIKKTFALWKQKKPKQLDDLFFQAHQKAFKKIDCLECANCCKTTSPIFREVDIKRISKSLRIKESAFIENYLKVDEDKDYVLKQSPCVFLSLDNTCSIYENRPLACREYPHTDRKNMYQILDLTERNISVCPAVAKIVAEITIPKR